MQPVMRISKMLPPHSIDNFFGIIYRCLIINTLKHVFITFHAFRTFPEMFAVIINSLKFCHPLPKIKHSRFKFKRIQIAVKNCLYTSLDNSRRVQSPTLCPTSVNNLRYNNFNVWVPEITHPLKENLIYRMSSQFSMLMLRARTVSTQVTQIAY